jgi:outer membrane protein OmpA-like peptidoglycan-associated protein
MIDLQSKKSLFFFILFICAAPCVAQNEYLIERMSSQINTNADEITPVIDWDGKVLYFTRVASPDFNKNLLIEGEDQSQVLTTPEYDKLLKEVYSKIAETTVLDPVHSGFNQDIWIANTTVKEFDKVVHPPAPINNALPNSISAMMPQLRTFLVINQFIPDGGMDVGFSVIRQINDSTWSFPEPLTIDDYYTRQSGTSISMSSDGEVMIMGLSRNDTYGDLDLYISFRKEDNTWSAPKNMGKKINTKYRESTPYLSLDMKRLYFSSNRPTSLGGMDLYFMDREDDTWENWSEEKHFIAPINSRFDDSQPCFNPTTGFFYFTSKRDGSSDIYRVQTAPPTPAIVTIKGKITNGKDDSPIDADILFGVKGSDNLKINYTKNGEFSINIPKGLEYKIFAQKEGYISTINNIKVEKYQHYPRGLNLDIKLVPIAEGEKITLQNLYFKQSEPEILPQSFEELNDLANLLWDNKTIDIQIEGHTDNTGAMGDLLTLSEKRAESIKTFLVNKNIKAERITVKGFGGNYPIHENPKTEAERQANRRVEIRIIKK